MKTNHTLNELTALEPYTDRNATPIGVESKGLAGIRYDIVAEAHGHNHQANAAELVRRWNAHAVLLAVVQRFAEADDYDQTDIASLQRTARIALAKVTNQS